MRESISRVDAGGLDTGVGVDESFEARSGVEATPLSESALVEICGRRLKGVNDDEEASGCRSGFSSDSRFRSTTSTIPLRGLDTTACDWAARKRRCWMYLCMTGNAAVLYAGKTGHGRYEYACKT